MAGIPDPCTRNEWKWHMKADIAHDGGAAILGYTSMDLPAVYGGQNTKAPRFPPEPWDKLPLNEDIVRDELLKSDLMVNAEARKPMRFFLRVKGDQFMDEKGEHIVFNPFPNEAVGVYHDAGISMFPRIPLARNLSGFGTPIDPAPKPLDGLSYFPFGGEVRIPGCTFGFNPKVVGDIVVRDFRGTNVKCGIYLTLPGQNQAFYDGSTGQIISGPDALQPTLINKGTGLFSGNGANGKMSGSPGDLPYYIGKAMGDAMQVVMCMNQPWNTGYAVGKPLTGGGTVAYVLLNTGDRLEYTRAALLGVSCIYLGPKQNGVRTGDFMPGIDAAKTPEQLIEEYKNKLRIAAAEGGKRFTNCLNSLRASFDSGTFNTAYSKLGGTPYVTTAEQGEKALQFMKSCATVVEVVMGRVVPAVSAAAEEGVRSGDLDIMVKLYQQIMSELDSRFPPGAIVTGKGYAVGNLPRKFRISVTEETSYYIKFQEAFETIKRGGDPTQYLVASPPLAPTGGRRRTYRKRKGGARTKGSPGPPTRSVSKLGMLTSPAPPTQADLTEIVENAKAPTIVALFNAFACHTNAQNAAVFGLDLNGTIRQNINHPWAQEFAKGKQLYKYTFAPNEVTNAAGGLPLDERFAYVVSDPKNQNEFTDFLEFIAGAPLVKIIQEELVDSTAKDVVAWGAYAIKVLETIDDSMKDNRLNAQFLEDRGLFDTLFTQSQLLKQRFMIRAAGRRPFPKLI